MSERSAPNKNRPYHHGNLRDALITAAAELIEETGSDDVAMVDAARRAGVSSAAPYRHFSDRDALLDCVAQLGFLDLSNQLQTVRDSLESGTEQCIIALGRKYIEFLTSKPAFFSLMWGERSARAMAKVDEEQAKTHAAGFWLLVNEVGAWCEREELPDVDPLDISVKLWSTAFGLAHLTLTHHLERFLDDVDPYAILTSSMHSFLRGVKEPGTL